MGFCGVNHTLDFQAFLRDGKGRGYGQFQMWGTIVKSYRKTIAEIDFVNKVIYKVYDDGFSPTTTKHKSFIQAPEGWIVRDYNKPRLTPDELDNERMLGLHINVY